MLRDHQDDCDMRLRPSFGHGSLTLVARRTPGPFLQLGRAIFTRTLFFLLVLVSTAGPVDGAEELRAAGGEANLKLPDLNQARFLGDSIGGKGLLYSGLVVSVAGIAFGLVVCAQLRKLPVHTSMSEVSELIYETCKTYLLNQGKFLFVLWLFIGSVIVFYFKYLQNFETLKVAMILLFSVVGILGSYGVAWFGIRVNTLANSRTAFASLAGRAYPCYALPLKAGISIGMLLISVELLLMLVILLFIPGDYAGPCFIGFAIGESLGAA